MSSRYAVLGQPIAQSLSPVIHGAFAQQLGIALTYERIEVAPEALADRLTELHAHGYLGLNVTAPHKLGALAAASAHTPRAELAGAANTLSRDNGGWRADNTDGEGLVRDLRENLRWAIAGKRVLLLGSGGAARGVMKPLLEAQPAELIVSGRTPWNVEKLAIAFKDHGKVTPRTHVTLKGDCFDLVLNATSTGLDGQAPRLPAGIVGKDGAAYDLNYGKAAAPFCDWARAQGVGRVADGLGMLVEQAAASFALWHGKAPKTPPVIAQLRSGMTS